LKDAPITSRGAKLKVNAAAGLLDDVEGQVPIKVTNKKKTSVKMPGGDEATAASQGRSEPMPTYASRHFSFEQDSHLLARAERKR
jgi:hypothetical protein